MTNYETVNYIKAKESVVKFLATETHKNVVSHFNESKYTCDLKTEKGCFLQSIFIDEVEEKVVMQVFWDFTVAEERKDKIIECLKRIDESQSLPLYAVEVDSLGRIYSSACENYETHEVTIETLKCIEELCLETYENFSSEVASVNAGNDIDEDFFDNIVDASCFWDLDDEDEDSCEFDAYDVSNFPKFTSDFYRDITLRPAFHKGTIVLFELVFNDAKLFKVGINICNALGLKNGHSCYIRGKCFFGDEKYEYIDLYMTDEVLDNFILCYGTDDINEKIIVMAETVYEAYSSSGDPYYNDSELESSFKLIKII